MDTKKRGEYITKMTLTQNFAKATANNSFISSVSTIQNLKDDITWEEFDETWSSKAAERQWIPGSENESVVTSNEICKYKGLDTAHGKYYENDFNERLHSIVGKEGEGYEIDQAVIEYDWGRYEMGLKLKDTIAGVWTVNVPETFRLSFWIKAKIINGESDQTFMRLLTEDG